MTDKKIKNLTAKELANELSLNAQYVRDIARMGLIPAKKLGNAWRFDLEAVEEQLERNAALAVQRSMISSNNPKDD